MRLIASSLVSMAILAGLLFWNSRGPSGIVIYCAAALQPAVEEIARAFEAETGGRVQPTYGASQVLLARLELKRDGDLFIPADDSYLRLVADKNLIAARMPLTHLKPVVAVAAGNPLGIHQLADLLKPNVRLSLPNPDTAAIGRVVRGKLADQWPDLAARARVVRITVGDVATDVKLGVADAGFVWDETVVQLPGLAAVELSELVGVEAQVAVAVLTTATQPDVARSFARFLTAPDRGGAILARRGFRTIPGEPWVGGR